MMTRWRKLGRVFTASGEYPWMRTHAQLPVPMHLGGTMYRIFFASRDAQQRSHVAYVEIDLDRPTEVLNVSSEPVLAPGPLGFFDDHGVYPASLVKTDDKWRMFIIGWNPGVRKPLFYASIGAAESTDGVHFQRVAPVPIMARSEHDPCLCTAPFVRRENDRWRMWYVSGFKWEETGDTLQSYYHVKYAESQDGLAWQRDGRVAIDLLPGERNIGRVTVIPDGGGYSMWYSRHAGDGYTIGYADSADGLTWERHDDRGGLELSPSGWDSMEIAYPSVFHHEGTKFMLYNGNGYGRDGFGIAVEEGSR